MPGGFEISPGAAISLASAAANVTVDYLTQPVPLSISSSGPWRPPQWGKQAVFSLTAPPTRAQKEQAIQAMTINPDGSSNYQKAPNQLLVFDAVMVANHMLNAVPTQHPLQVGINVSDHVIMQPVSIALDIAVSDAQDSYAAGMWAGNTSKSVSAFQILSTIQAERLPCTLATRLATYKNVFITNISPFETHETFSTLKARVSFQQLIFASVNQQTTSARPNATDGTPMGNIQPQPVSQTVENNSNVGNLLNQVSPDNSPANSTGTPGSEVGINQLEITSDEANAIQKAAAIPGAGTYSSTNVGVIPTTLVNP